MTLSPSTPPFSPPPSSPLPALGVSSRAIKVLQVIPALDDGGAQKSGVEMALYLQRSPTLEGITWASALASADGPMGDLLDRAGVPRYNLPLQSRLPWVIVGNAVRLALLARREQIDIFHARSRGPAWSAWLASRFTHLFSGWFGFQPVLFISTFHGLYGTRGPFKKFYNAVMLRGPLVIANSDFVRRHLMDTYGIEDSRITVAPRGIEPALFDPFRFSAADRSRLRAEFGVAPHEPLLLLLGRLTRWKGQDVFLKALAEIKDLPWKALLVGGPDKRGAFADELQRMTTDLGLDGRVLFTGSRDDVPLLNTVCDLALSCSNKPEAFGRVAIEAQAMGTPVIATALGGSLETIQHGVTGFLVPPDAPHPLAEKLREALTSPSRLATMGEAARAWVLSRFTVEACCRAEVGAYVKLLKLLRPSLSDV